MAITDTQWKTLAEEKPIQAKDLYRAIVINVKDPKKRARVKVWIPDLMFSNVEPDKGIWAMPKNNIFCGANNDTAKAQIGLDDCGSCLPPPKGSEVWIEFEDGDFNKPRYTEALNLDTEEAIPVENTYGPEYWNKWTMIKSPKGRQILISDDPDDACVLIRGKYKTRGKRKVEDDPRKPKQDVMYIELWEGKDKEYAIIKTKEEQYYLLDKTNNVNRIQHPSGSYIEMDQSGDIVIQAAKFVWINSRSPYVLKHD